MPNTAYIHKITRKIKTFHNLFQIQKTGKICLKQVLLMKLKLVGSFDMKTLLFVFSNFDHLIPPLLYVTLVIPQPYLNGSKWRSAIGSEHFLTGFPFLQVWGQHFRFPSQSESKLQTEWHFPRSPFSGVGHSPALISCPSTSKTKSHFILMIFRRY